MTQEWPDDVDQTWQSLREAVTRRQAAQQALREASLECRALVVRLLQLNVPRKDLVGQPFTSRALTTIQQKAGLTRRKQ